MAQEYLSEFLNPKSMITPGAAGGISMAIANTMWLQFGLEPKWIALLLSFSFGAMILMSPTISILQRAFFYVVNSLIIFTVAVGMNSAGNNMAVAPDDSVAFSLPSFGIIASAHAQSIHSTDAQIVRPLTEAEKRAAEARRQQQQQTQGETQKPKRKFFKKWF